MNKWNVWFTLKGPAGNVEAPNATNPVEAENMRALLTQLAFNLGGLESEQLDISVVGIRIEKLS